jgi:signal peptidase I
MLARGTLLREAVVLVALVGTLAALHGTISTYQVEGASMEPTIADRQYVLVDTRAASRRLFQRGAVIVFRPPNGAPADYVKRVVGLPGETVAVTRGAVLIDGRPLREPYVRELPRYALGPTRVPARAVFVLGDNRNSSADSHLWGTVPVERVIGRAWLVYRPLLAWQWLGGPAPALEAAPEAAPDGGSPAGSASGIR